MAGLSISGFSKQLVNYCSCPIHMIVQSSLSEHAEVYFNLLCAIDPKMLNKLSGSRETDDEIFADFTKSFPDLNVAKFSEDDIKSTKAKAEWREFW